MKPKKPHWLQEHYVHGIKHRRVKYSTLQRVGQRHLRNEPECWTLCTMNRRDDNMRIAVC